jgi:predicted acylesterase/phospholipase RssA
MALVAVPLTAIFDWMENHGIAVVLDKLKRGTPLVTRDATRISTPSLVKWITLALVLRIYGLVALQGLRTWNWGHAATAYAGLSIATAIAYTLVRYLRERIGVSHEPSHAFDQVLHAELDEIVKVRRWRAPDHPGGGSAPGVWGLERARSAKLLGLALSGGGIRSATFNLGILQGLARASLLSCFDYLSTVSGGGYIGSWLVAWIKRDPDGFAEVNKQLNPEWKDHSGKEPNQITFLRDYSNYLTPQLGILSADTWTAVTTYLRNLLLNLTILLSGILAVLLLPYLAVLGFRVLVLPAPMTGFVGLVLLTVSFCFFVSRINVVWLAKADPSGGQARIIVTMFVALFIGAYFLTSWIPDNLPWSRLSPYLTGWKVAAMGGVLLAAWVLIGILGPDPSAKSFGRWVLVCAVASYALLSLPGSVWAVSKLVLCFPDRNSASFHLLTLGVPLYLLTTLAAAGLQVGLTGLLFRNYMREWTARLGAWILIGIFGWAGLCAIVFYSPPLVIWGWQLVSAAVAGAGGIVGVLYAVTGAYLAWSEKTGKPGRSSPWDLYAQTLPPVLITGLFILLSFCIYKWTPAGAISSRRPTSTVKLTIAWSGDGSSGSTAVGLSNSESQTLHETWRRYWDSIKASDDNHTVKAGWPALAIAAALGLAWLLSRRVDINDFSMQLFYRNRLVRCYLGASHRPRRQDSFTGFDPEDDLLLKNLIVNPMRADSEPEVEENPYTGPYPVINTALNLTHGERLAWQERKAESFIMTPLYCGFDASQIDRPNRTPPGGPAYRPTAKYAYPDHGIYLGTAFATSGAAASPNMGHYTSAPLAFLMAVLNIRLGWWLGNPRRKDTWQKGSPVCGLPYLLAELFASTNDRSRYVYLSDGGHFENLGIYELVRRECRLILACDAAEDRNYAFGDLGNAIRQCRDDFGVDIKIDFHKIHPEGDPKLSRSHFSVGIVSYDLAHQGAKPGILIYVKASITGDESADVLEYKNNHRDFPHDTTADQWFSESQFESYRRLGQHIVEQFNEVDWRARISVAELLSPPEWNTWTDIVTSDKLDEYLRSRLGRIYSPQGS